MSITIATDLSARSDRAFDRAVQLSQQFGAKLTIVHALEAKQELSFQAQKERALRSLHWMTANLNMPFEFVLEYVSAPELVADVAQKRGSAMIVVGPARYNHVSDFFLGTAVDYMVRRASVPVLLVKQRPLAPYDGLVVGTDFSDRSRAALVSAATLFEKIPVTLVHAFGRPYSGRMESDASLEVGLKWSRDSMAKFLAHHDVGQLLGRIATKCIESFPTNAITEVSEQYRHPLAVLGTHGWGRVAQAVLGSLASEMLTDIPHDILIVRADESLERTG